MGTLQLTLPTPSTISISRTLKVRHFYGNTGKLNLFERRQAISPFPAKRFILEPAGLFGRIKDSAIRNGYEAAVFWNIEHESEAATAALMRSRKLSNPRFVPPLSKPFLLFTTFSSLPTSASRIVFTSSLSLSNPASLKLFCSSCTFVNKTFSARLLSTETQGSILPSCKNGLC